MTPLRCFLAKKRKTVEEILRKIALFPKPSIQRNFQTYIFAYSAEGISTFDVLTINVLILFFNT